MIVLGADMHKRSHTIAAVAAASGALLGEKTIQVGDRGFAAALGWARGLGAERVWALEDCRHVSGAAGPARRRARESCSCWPRRTIRALTAPRRAGSAGCSPRRRSVALTLAGHSP